VGKGKRGNEAILVQLWRDSCGFQLKEMGNVGGVEGN
jgi:hypothetical protein